MGGGGNFSYAFRVSSNFASGYGAATWLLDADLQYLRSRGYQCLELRAPPVVCASSLNAKVVFGVNPNPQLSTNIDPKIPPNPEVSPLSPKP